MENKSSVESSQLLPKSLLDLPTLFASPSPDLFTFNSLLHVALGEGKSAEEVLASRLTVTEGVATAAAMAEIAGARGIELPIAEAVHAVLSGRTTVDAAIGGLLARPLRSEI